MEPLPVEKQFDSDLVERIRLAGGLPDDTGCVEQTGETLSSHLNLLKGLLIQEATTRTTILKPYRPSRPRATTADQNFIHYSYDLVVLLTNPKLVDARLFNWIVYDVICSLQTTCLALHKQYIETKHQQLTKIIKAIPSEIQNIVQRTNHNNSAPGIDVVAQRLLNLHPEQLTLEQKSLAIVQRLSDVPNLRVLYHSNYDAHAIGADSKNDVRNTLDAIHTAINRLTISSCCTDDNRRTLTALSERANKATADDGKLIGRWRSPELSRRIMRDMIVVELRVIYRFLTTANDRHSKRDRFSATHVGHQNEPTDTIAPTPFASIVRLVLEHIEGVEIPGETLASIITHCCRIADPIAVTRKDLDTALRHSLIAQDVFHHPKTEPESRA